MTTRLILVRHAKPNYSFSDNPPLSSEGIVIHQKVTEEMKREGFTLDEIYSSPLKRAQETAEIMAETYGLDVVVDEVLAGFDFQALVKRARECEEEKTTLFVGHAPTLRELAVEFSKSEVPRQIQKSQIFVLEFNGKVTKENNISFQS